MEASLQTLPSDAVEFGGEEGKSPEDSIYLYMREPGVLGTADKLPGIAYMYVSRAAAREIVSELTARLQAV